MPKEQRQRLLSQAQRRQILALPTDSEEIAKLFTLSRADIELIRRHRSDSNRLGYALQLLYVQKLGRVWMPDSETPTEIVESISKQLGVQSWKLQDYANRDETRREHLSDLMDSFGWITMPHKGYLNLSPWLLEIAMGSDHGMHLMRELLSELRRRRILMPAIGVLERFVSAIRHRARHRTYDALTKDLTDSQRKSLDRLLETNDNSRLTRLGRIRTPSESPTPTNILKKFDRLEELRMLGIPIHWLQRINQNRLIHMSREASVMNVWNIRRFGIKRRYATLVSVVLDSTAHVTDDILEMHNRILGSQFRKAEKKHMEAFQQHARSINEKVSLFAKIGQSLIHARHNETSPWEAIDSQISWDGFLKSVEDAQSLARPESFDYLEGVGNYYAQQRRYSPKLLEAFQFKASPACQELLQAIEVLKGLNKTDSRTVPTEAVTGFVRPRWRNLVFQSGSIDRRFYEMCVLSELSHALRSGDMWVAGSRQYRNFEEYLIPPNTFKVMRNSGLPIAFDDDAETYIGRRSDELDKSLQHVNQLVEEDRLPEATFEKDRLKINRIEATQSNESSQIMRQIYGLFPRVKVTDLLVEVDSWCHFSSHFTHIRNGEPTKDRTLLLSALLADAINLGITRMADACPGMSLSKLAKINSLFIRDETYAQARSEIVNHHYRLPFTQVFGDGSTSSSDGQHFRSGGLGEAIGQANARYGSGGGALFYTHVSDQYAPFFSQVINANVRDATFVLDGLLYHETDLKIDEHYTDTAGFSDHVFALCHLLGFRFAPRIRGLADKRLYPIENFSKYPSLAPLLGQKLNTQLIINHWDDVLRLATSIKQGTVTASTIIRKLAAYPRQNRLAAALREVGRLERTLFTLDYLNDVEFRKRIHAGLNKGEARNALARAVFFNRLGELRDRTYEDQQHRAGGLSLVVAAIVLWNTVYLQRAIQVLKDRGISIDDTTLRNLSPLGWEHINLTGDYVWRSDGGIRSNDLRPLRLSPKWSPQVP